MTMQDPTISGILSAWWSLDHGILAAVKAATENAGFDLTGLVEYVNDSLGTSYTEDDIWISPLI